jgi:hypothetical protein
MYLASFNVLTTRLLTVIYLFIFLTLNAIASETKNSNPSKDKIETKMDGTPLKNEIPSSIENECEELINSLKGTDPNLKQDNNEGKQKPKRVWVTENRLLSYGVKAFPILMKHIDDKDYSYSTGPLYNDPPKATHNITIGDVCKEIIKLQVDLIPFRYRTRIGADGKDHVYDNYFSEIDIKSWWRERQNKTLSELRNEIIEWYIQRERQKGFITPEDEKEYLEPLLQKQSELKTMGEKPRELQLPQPLPIGNLG